MSIEGKLGPIRKGLLEFLSLRIISADKVYVADMLKLIGSTEFRAGRRYRSPARCARKILSITNGGNQAGPPASITASPRGAGRGRI